MKSWAAAAIQVGLALATAQPLFAQSSRSGGLFVDTAWMSDRDPTEFFYGADTGVAGRGSIGVQTSGLNGLRFEVDVPRWRTTDTSSSAPVYCAETAGCVGGVGLVPAHTTSHAAVRSVSYAALYARHVPVSERVQLSLLAGGAIEDRAFRSQGTFDELAADGRVVRHTEFADARTKGWPAIVLGFDMEVGMTRHLAVVPQFRFHTFPYPRVSIVRPGVALRWRF